MEVQKLISQNADKIKKLLRIIFILFFLIAGLYVMIHPAKTQTNILNAVFSENYEDSTVVKLSGRYSSKINVMAESDDAEKSSQTIDKFYEMTDKNIFTVKEMNINKMLDTYKKYQYNLLSSKNIKRLENNFYESVTAESLENLYNPLGITLLPLDEDPFMLFTDYIKSLSTGSGDYSLINYNDKYYSVLTLEINPDTALSPTKINGEIKKLIKQQKKLSVDGVKVYLTGTPIHSYYASSRSMLEINIICILSAVFLFALFRYYFSNIKLIIPTAISISLGILLGYIVCSLIFHSIHVLTFVFSTTLIGICIDYSLHYYIEKDLSKIFKSLTVSMLTTVSAFAVLLFSGVELLKQIAVFTMTGLFSVYLMVVLFYPLLKIKTEERTINFSLSDKAKKILLYSVIAVAFCGLFFIRFNDDIKDMYVPSKKLAGAEKLFKNVTGNNSKITFAVVNGDTFQELLENEEKLTNEIKFTKFQALSKYLPSHKQQARNRELRKNLYTNELKNYSVFLTPAQVSKLLNETYPEDYLDFDIENSVFSEFLLDKNTSLVILYDIKEPQTIIDNGYKYIDVQKTISERIKTCRKNCLTMIIPVFAILFILLSAIYKPKNTLKILTPSLLASTFSIGILSLFKVEINLFHVLAIFLIIGFGLDYSVFKAGGIKGSKDAVLLSCLATIFSFLLLALTNFKLISSLGLILSIGLSVSYLTSLIFEYNKEPSE